MTPIPNEDWFKTYIQSEISSLNRKMDTMSSNQDLLVVEVTKLKTLQEVSKEHRLASSVSGGLSGAIATIIIYFASLLGLKIT